MLAALEGALEVALRDDAVRRAARDAVVRRAGGGARSCCRCSARRRWPFEAPAAVWLLAAAALVRRRAAGLVRRGDHRRRHGRGVPARQPPRRASGAPRPGRRRSAARRSSSTTTPTTRPATSCSSRCCSGSPGWRASRCASGPRRPRRPSSARRQAEREREAAARIAVAEERARIARELHDIVAHAVSVMVLQVGAVRHNLPASRRRGRGGAARRRADRPHGAGRDAPACSARCATRATSVELAPQPGLGRPRRAAGRAFGRAGLPVQLHVDGEPVALPRALDLSAYRIVQEGLTNALKHAHAGHADVVVRYRPGELEIDVRDDGHGGAARRRPRPRAGRHPRAREDLRRRDDRRRRGRRRLRAQHALPARRGRADDASACSSPTTSRWSAPGFRMLLAARAGHRGRGRGGQRPRGGPPGRALRPDRRAHGHPHARARRAGGHPAHPRRRRPARAS